MQKANGDYLVKKIIGIAQLYGEEFLSLFLSSIKGLGTPSNCDCTFLPQASFTQVTLFVLFSFFIQPFFLLKPILVNHLDVAFGYTSQIIHKVI